MLDRQKIETLLARRFPGAERHQIAAATNGIMGLDDEWEELEGAGWSLVATHVPEVLELRVLRRVTSDGPARAVSPAVSSPAASPVSLKL